MYISNQCRKEDKDERSFTGLSGNLTHAIVLIEAEVIGVFGFRRAPTGEVKNKK